MTLVRHPLSTDALQDMLQRRASSAPPGVALAIQQAHEVVVFGSVARGVDGPDSDLDVLLVNGSERLRSRSLDLVCADQRRTFQRWWLGGELAGHVATFGIWISGRGHWRDSVFVSDWSIRKKKSRILFLLSEAYVRRDILSRRHLAHHAERIVLELLRLELLQAGAFIPTTDELRDSALTTDFAVMDVVVDLIGHPPGLMLEAILANVGPASPRVAVDALFRTAWSEHLARAHEWREAGRPTAGAAPKI